MTFNRSNLLSLFLFHLLVPTQVQALNTDGVLLLSFKYSILSDPLSVLRNWNYDDETPCLWTGVTCTELGKPNTPDMFRVTSLVLPNKHLLRSVTPDLFSLPHLRILDLSSNFFNGSLPDSVFNATELSTISLGSNNLSGDLPTSINSVANLQLLNLSANAFTGKIPLSLSLLKNLTVVSLTKNSFSGDIPGGFEAVQVLDLSSNLLNGSLPLDLGGRSMHYLSLSHNHVSGVIPTGFAEKFPANATVDLSFNNLTGPIPGSLSLLNQKAESFSGNPELCGKPLKTLCTIPSTLSNPPNIPENTSPAIAVKPRSSAPPTNPLTESPNQTVKSKLKPSTIAVIIVADIVGLAIIGLFVLYVYQVRKRRRSPESSPISLFTICLDKNEAKKSSSQSKPSVVEVNVTESPDAKTACGSCIILNGGRYDETSTSESDVENQQTLQAFDRTDGGRLKQNAQTQLVTVDGETQLDLETLLKASAYLLGTNGTGIVYKAVLENGTAFAVRRIETESCVTTKVKEFEREVRAIAKLRHPNLVRVRGFCWGNDEKLLISDYVPNGSLLSSFTATKTSSSSSTPSFQHPLSFEARVKIARGMARGLSYINEKKYVHGNIKPNNILLNSENEPIITDLGLDRLMTPAREPHTNGPTSSSPCYQPPERSSNQKPNPKWDVYSFGVILLELLTGKTFSVDQNIDQWLELSCGSEAEEKGRFLRLIDGAIRSDVARHEDAAMVCFRLGIECVSSLPQKRPSMKEVVQVLEKVSCLNDIFFSDNISNKKLPKMEERSTTSAADSPEIQFQPPNPPNQIFILSGQSNMAGRGGVVKDHHHNRWVWDKIVPPECAPDTSILRLRADLRWEEAREPLHADIDTGKVCGVGPGMAFANAVRKRFDSDSDVIGLVPCAVGGTAIKEWARGSHLYETMVKRAEESRKYGGEIKAMLWYQGESDVLDIHDAESYGRNMISLIKNLRHDLKLPSLPIIQVAIASGGGYIDKVREAQLGLKLSNVVCVDAKGLPLKPDNLHLTTEAQVQLGLSLAQAYLSNFS